MKNRNMDSGLAPAPAAEEKAKSEGNGNGNDHGWAVPWVAVISSVTALVLAVGTLIRNIMKDHRKHQLKMKRLQLGLEKTNCNASVSTHVSDGS